MKKKLKTIFLSNIIWFILTICLIYIGLFYFAQRQDAKKIIQVRVLLAKEIFYSNKTEIYSSFKEKNPQNLKNLSKNFRSKSFKIEFYDSKKNNILNNSILSEKISPKEFTLTEKKEINIYSFSLLKQITEKDNLLGYITISYEYNFLQFFGIFYHLYFLIVFLLLSLLIYSIFKKSLKKFIYSPMESLKKSSFIFSNNNNNSYDQKSQKIKTELETLENEPKNTIITNFHRSFLELLLHFIKREKTICDDIDNIVEKKKSIEQNYNKTLEKSKELKNELKLSQQVKTIFLESINHEIRTPLNAILGYTELLNDNISDKKQLKQLKSIKENGNDLLSIFDNILDFSKIESETLKIYKKATNIKQIAYNLKNSLKNKLKNLEFLLEIDNNLQKNYLLDETQLHKILYLLLDNAIKFTNIGYVSLTIKVEKNNRMNSETDNIIFTVEDTGIGIEKNDLDKIFQSFSKGKIRENSFNGVGLGLSIVDRTTKFLGGRLEISSKPNKGSKFQIILTDVEISNIKREKRKREFEQISPNFIKFDKAKVLIVDDIKYIRELITEFLDIYDFETFEAKNGEEALKLTYEQMPDIILLDIKMPILSGLDVLKELKSNPKTSSIPIVVVTASVMDYDKIDIIKSGSDGYLRKPISRIDLINELKNHLIFHRIDKKPKSKRKIEEKKSQKITEKEKLEDILSKTIPLWETISEDFVFEEIKDFATDISKLAQKHNFSALYNWAEDIRELSDEFDIANLKVLLKKFPLFYKKLKDNLEQ